MSSRALKRMISRGTVWALLTVGFIALLFFGHAAWKVYMKEREAAKDDTLASEHYDELLLRQTALTASVGKLNTSRGVEEEIRKRYPVAKSGEEVITLINPKSGPGKASTSTRQGFWSSFGSWFGN